MITMFYDSTCPICAAEANHLAGDDILIITIKDGLKILNQHGIDDLTAMTYLCVIDGNDKLHTGIHAVRLVHKTTNTKFNRVLHLPIIKQMSAWVYPLFAKYRYKIPTWLIDKMFGTLNMADNCQNGVCQLSPKERLKNAP